MSSHSDEAYKPALHVAPDGAFNALLFTARRMTDFQVATVYKGVRNHAASFHGTVVDIGCGEMPYRHLLPPTMKEYIGLEVSSDSVWRRQSDIRLFDGHTMPLVDGSVDSILCTEVLEHTPEPARLLAEIHRVMKPGGFALFTVPWSARFHYVPHDYYRFTPSALARLFGRFQSVEIEARGTDVAVICAKIIVVYLRATATLRQAQHWWKAPILVALFPLMPVIVACGHLSLWCGFGSKEDPLGYTVTARK